MDRDRGAPEGDGVQDGGFGDHQTGGDIYASERRGHRRLAMRAERLVMFQEWWQTRRPRPIRAVGNQGSPLSELSMSGNALITRCESTSSDPAWGGGRPLQCPHHQDGGAPALHIIDQRLEDCEVSSAITSLHTGGGRGLLCSHQPSDGKW